MPPPRHMVSGIPTRAYLIVNTRAFRNLTRRGEPLRPPTDGSAAKVVTDDMSLIREALVGCIRAQNAKSAYCMSKLSSYPSTVITPPLTAPTGTSNMTSSLRLPPGRASVGAALPSELVTMNAWS